MRVKPIRICILLFLLQFLLTFRAGELAWDGAFYYGTARSLLFDGDLHLANDLALSYATHPNPDFEAAHFEAQRTATGHVRNPFAIGAALLWLPWLALVRVPAEVAGLAGLGPHILTGYEPIFVWSAACVTAVYGGLAALLGLHLARRVAGERAALTAAVVATLTTPLVYYQFREPFYAHAASALTVALFVTAWWRNAGEGKLSVTSALLLGVLGGLTTLVRWQNVLYLILPLSTILDAGCRAIGERDRAAILRALRPLPFLALSGVPVVSLQLAAWKDLYGQLWLVPQGGQFLDWRAPWIGHVLVSSFHGILPWMPLAVPALAGLILLARRRPRLALPLLAAFLLQVYVNGSVRDWFGGGGYGARRFSGTFVILVVGYSVLLTSATGRWGKRCISLLSGLLVLHQFLLLRYGFAARIGGYDTGPTTYHADGLARFAQQLAGTLATAVRHPLQSLVMPGSPVDLARRDPLAALTQPAILAGVMGSVWMIAKLTGWQPGVEEGDRERQTRSPDPRCPSHASPPPDPDYPP
jgi:hypothetical protein